MIDLSSPGFTFVYRAIAVFGAIIIGLQVVLLMGSVAFNLLEERALQDTQVRNLFVFVPVWLVVGLMIKMFGFDLASRVSFEDGVLRFTRYSRNYCIEEAQVAGGSVYTWPGFCIVNLDLRGDSSLPSAIRFAATPYGRWSAYYYDEKAGAVIDRLTQ